MAGPDWLTVVLAGMHNTDVWRNLSVQMPPTTLLIAGPATMAGAFQIRVAEGGAWLGTSSLLLFFAAACQVLLWLSCSRAHSCRQCTRSLTLGCNGAGHRHHALLLSNHGNRREARGGAEGTCPLPLRCAHLPWRAKPLVQDKPNDREVEELLEIFEKTEAPILRALEERIHWQTGTPTRAMRFMLIAGTVAMCVACTGIRYYSSKCFVVRHSA